jgi:beta-glucanase (GH16 family)
MTSLRIMLGLVPSTSQVETKEKELQKEFQDFIEYSSSDEVKKYHQLKELNKSGAFKRKLNELKALNFKNTAEYRKEKEYKQLSKTKDIVSYYKTVQSRELSDYQQMEKSDILKKYHELEQFIRSDAYRKVKDYMSLSAKRKFEQSEEYKILNDYKRLKDSSPISGYYKFIKNKAFADFERIHGSDFIEKYSQLEKKVNSPDFRQKLHSMKKKDRKYSEEFSLLREFKAQKNSREIRNYFNVLQSPLQSNYQKMKGSKDLDAFEKLETYIQSSDYKSAKHNIEAQKFKNTKEFASLEEYKRLDKSKEFKDYFKFKKSYALNNYTKLHGSERIAAYEELGKYLGSEEFMKVKTYMNLPAKKKFELTEEYTQQEELKLLDKSEKIKWYLRLCNTKKFDELKSWKMTFDDDFNTSSIDKSKWITNYYWGEALLKTGYSLDPEKQFYTDNNFEIRNSVLRIITRKEKVSGRAWINGMGFYPRDFEYSSGLISTGNTFRQKYGRFEAKVKLNKTYPVCKAFWMISDMIVPHIDVVKMTKKPGFNYFWGNIMQKGGLHKITSSACNKYSKDFYIFTLIWTPNSLTWKVNGITVASKKVDVPQEPMYINFSSSLYSDPQGGVLPADMEIDWVRCYQENKA